MSHGRFSHRDDRRCCMPATDTRFFTLQDVAAKLQVNDDPVRRLFISEPAVVIIGFPRLGRRVYRTLRIPEHVLDRVLTRLPRVASCYRRGHRSAFLASVPCSWSARATLSSHP